MKYMHERIGHIEFERELKRQKISTEEFGNAAYELFKDTEVYKALEKLYESQTEDMTEAEKRSYLAFESIARRSEPLSPHEKAKIYPKIKKIIQDLVAKIFGKEFKFTLTDQDIDALLESARSRQFDAKKAETTTETTTTPDTKEAVTVEEDVKVTETETATEPKVTLRPSTSTETTEQQTLRKVRQAFEVDYIRHPDKYRGTTDERTKTARSEQRATATKRADERIPLSPKEWLEEIDRRKKSW